MNNRQQRTAQSTTQTTKKDSNAPAPPTSQKTSQYGSTDRRSQTQVEQTKRDEEMNGFNKSPSIREEAINSRNEEEEEDDEENEQLIRNGPSTVKENRTKLILPAPFSKSSSSK